VSFGSNNLPIVYGLALDGEVGVAVDNFPMRGSSGLGFTKINRNRYSAQLSAMNVVAVILQFGVNIIPDERENYDYYEKWFSQQLKSIQTAGPEVAIIVIGPSDMGKNNEGEIVSYENIPLIRDAMKSAALKNGCCFWDLYKAMGGENSMSAWVKDDLAQKDYTHFTYKGARYVGEMLYNSIMDFE
jgi:lysophospholipase L1-like esterase